MTSAPKSAKSMVLVGPAKTLVRSRTLTPFKGGGMPPLTSDMGLAPAARRHALGRSPWVEAVLFLASCSIRTSTREKFETVPKFSPGWTECQMSVYCNVMVSLTENGDPLAPDSTCNVSTSLTVLSLRSDSVAAAAKMGFFSSKTLDDTSFLEDDKSVVQVIRSRFVSTLTFIIPLCH